MITSRSFWGEERIYFHDAQGRLSAIPRDWTDLAQPDPFETIAAGRSWFRMEDLLELAHWIERRRDGV